jgi:four helix bundle protein
LKLERKNVNRGFTKLRVWDDAIVLFKLVYKMASKLPYELSKTKNNIIDASHSISRNIAEGYCRKNLKEYLNFLNIALGSTGELFSGMIAIKEIGKIGPEEFEEFDKLHLKLENELISLIKSLQEKSKQGQWNTSFID